MLAGVQQNIGLIMMQVVGRTDVYNIDTGIVREFVDRVIGLAEAKRLSGILGPVGGAPEYSSHRNAEASQRFHMSSADETKADYGCPQVLHRSPQGQCY